MARKPGYRPCRVLKLAVECDKLITGTLGGTVSASKRALSSCGIAVQGLLSREFLVLLHIGMSNENKDTSCRCRNAKLN